MPNMTYGYAAQLLLCLYVSCIYNKLLIAIGMELISYVVHTYMHTAHYKVSPSHKEW